MPLQLFFMLCSRFRSVTPRKRKHPAPLMNVPSAKRPLFVGTSPPVVVILFIMCLGIAIINISVGKRTIQDYIIPQKVMS